MKIIVIGCHKGLTRCVIKSLLSSKVKFTFIGLKELKRSVSLSKFCESFYEIEEKDLHIEKESIKKLLSHLANSAEQNFIIPTGIRSTLYVSRHASKTNGVTNSYPITGYETLSMLNNKWDFYKFIQKLNVPTPQTILYDSNKILDHVLTFPVITKPLDSENSENVRKSDSLKELNAVGSGTSFPILIQEYIPGVDINLCIFSLQGEVKAWTINRRTDKGILFEQNQEILEWGKKIVRSLNYSGLIHFDIRYSEDDKRIMFLECNPRVWASILHSVYVGVNFIELAMKSVENPIYFTEVEKGTISHNKKSIMNKIIKPSISKMDFKSIFIQGKLLLKDPLYELDFILNHKH